MSNQTNGNQNSQTSYNNGRNDSQSGKGPANTNGWTWQDRQSYDAGHKSGQNQTGGKR